MSVPVDATVVAIVDNFELPGCKRSEKMELLEAIKWAGVVGEGGAGFPTYAKLDTRAECFIVNGAECEPLIETDKYLMRTFPDRSSRGRRRVRPPRRQTYRYRAQVKIQGGVGGPLAGDRKSGAAIEIVKMPAFYPAGDEHTMVYYVTGRSIPRAIDQRRLCRGQRRNDAERLRGA
ncbi:MAG: hypothetical protein ACLUEQ_01675 [Cloacibacillus evryensis]